MIEPWTSAVRKWMPPQTRASMISLMAWEKRVKLLVVPETALVALNSILSVPKKSCRVCTIEPLRQLWPEGCSG